MPLTVGIVGLKELERKLDGKFLIQPEVESALDTVAQRGKRGGKGQGAKVNPIALRGAPLTRILTSPIRSPGNRIEAIPSFGRGAGRRKNPRFNPRSKGTSWIRKNVGAAGYGAGILGATARNALAKAAKKIAARWAS